MKRLREADPELLADVIVFVGVVLLIGGLVVGCLWALDWLSP